MNNIFNHQRFMMLFKKHTIEHAKTYLLSVAVLIGLLFLVLGFYSYTSNRQLGGTAQMVTFIFFILIGGSIFTSLTFIELGDKRKSIPFLTLPASHFEKFLVSWIYSFVLFQVVLIGAFYLTASIIISMGAAPDEGSRLINVFAMGQKPYGAFIIYAVFHGLTIWGAIFFEKMHFIKTAFVFFICLIVLLVINSQTLNLLISKDTEGVPFIQTSITTNHHYWQINPGKGVTHYGRFILYLTVVLLWTSAFFRLKEKEV